jgi:hypothetical protein
MPTIKEMIEFSIKSNRLTLKQIEEKIIPHN